MVHASSLWSSFGSRARSASDTELARPPAAADEVLLGPEDPSSAFFSSVFAAAGLAAACGFDDFDAEGSMMRPSSSHGGRT